MTSVLLDIPDWFYRPNRTDYRYMRTTIPRLAEFDSTLIFQTRDRFASLSRNAADVLDALRRRAGQPSPKGWSHEIGWRTRRAALQRHSVILTNDLYPLNASGHVIWQNTIVEPEMALAWGARQDSINYEIEKKLPLFNAATSVIVSTESERNRLAMYDAHLVRRVHAIPFFLPALPPSFEPSLLEKQNDKGELRILFVGNDALRKGLDDLITAVASLPNTERSRIHLVIISRFTDGDVTMDPLADVQHTVIHGASHSQVIDQMRRAHVLINPAKYETYGFVFIEAMSCGAIPVGPGWQVQREVLHGAGICLPTDRSRDVIRDVLTQLVSDDAGRSALAAKAGAKYQTDFAPPVVARSLSQLIHATGAL